MFRKRNAIGLDPVSSSQNQKKSRTCKLGCCCLPLKQQKNALPIDNRLIRPHPCFTFKFIVAFLFKSYICLICYPIISLFISHSNRLIRLIFKQFLRSVSSSIMVEATLSRSFTQTVPSIFITSGLSRVASRVTCIKLLPGFVSCSDAPLSLVDPQQRCKRKSRNPKFMDLLYIHLIGD